jgi:Arc/MetJ family transcription regulator
MCMARTNIDIDEELIGRVMRRLGLRTKREAVDYALRHIDVAPMSTEEALAVEGSGWSGDHDEDERLEMEEQRELEGRG